MLMASEPRSHHEAALDPDGQITVQENSSTEVDLESQDIAYLRDEWEDDVSITPQDGHTELTVSNKAGVIGLPSGRILSIQPKISTNLLYMLAYTDRISEQIITDETNAGYEVGDSLIELLARLFLRELKRVMRRGLAQEFQQTEATQRHLRGQLQLDKQLQRQGPVPLQFECRYQELTQDTTLNRVVLAALQTLTKLVASSSLRSELIQYRERISERVAVPADPRRELSKVRTSHLTAHYHELLLLSEAILTESFIGALGQPDPEFPSLVFDMPKVFEDAVVKAVQSSVDQSQFQVTTNDLGVLARRTTGTESDTRRLEPDFIIRRRTDDPPSDQPVVVVGDAKWKESTDPSTDDLYQLATYQGKFGTPGLLVYPTAGTQDQKRYRYDDSQGSDAGRGDLIITQLSIGPAESLDRYTEVLESTLKPELDQLLVGN
jgi:5-methylcytosine-specific restriction enzyme subunit McrC